MSKYQNMTYTFSFMLKKIGEGKINLTDIDEMVKRRLADNPTESIQNLERIRWEFQQLSDMFITSILKNTDNQKIIKKPSKEVDLTKNYSITELEQILKVSRKTVYNYMGEGRLGFVQLSEKKRVVSQKQLDEFLSGH